MRYYAIGDIHGRADLIEKAIQKIYVHSKNEEIEHKIITLGDYIDRGPNSKKVLDTIMLFNESGKMISLQGNHESMMVDSIQKDLDPQWWMGNGGGATLASFGHPFTEGKYKYGDEVYYSWVPEEYVKFIATLPKFYEAEKQVYVHAGIPQWGMNLPPKAKNAHKVALLEEQMQWMLYHPSDHGGWKGKHVVHGHHQFADGPHTFIDPKKGGRTDLDTFAWKTGRLVVGVFDDSQLTAIDYIEVLE